MASRFDVEIDRRGTGAYKWDRYAGTDVLPLWVADMDFASPPAVVEGLHRRVEHGVFGYTHAWPSCDEAVLDYLRDRHAVDVPREWLAWLPGCVPALSMACAATGSSGDAVITFTPVYPPFRAVHRDSQRTLREIPLTADDQGRYDIDFEALEEAAAAGAKTLLFCNPHNPVGRVFDGATVRRVAAICERYDMLLCSDEIHCDLVLDEQKTPFVSALSLDDRVRQRLIVLMAASKTYNVAGLACSFALIPHEGLRRRFRQAAGKLLSEISPLGFAATEAAYRGGEAWRQELLAYLRGNRDRIAEFVRARCPGLVASPVEATYLAWFDARPLGLPDPHRHFEQHGLGFSNGVDFGTPGFVRMNFGTTRARVEEALRRLERAVAAAAGSGLA
jgi:cystathionine beta-lyase